MKFLSVDLETTGLDPTCHQILEIGVVVGDWETPLEKLPVWSCQIAHQEVHGHPYALMMNASLIASIAKPVPGVTYFPSCQEAYASLWGWLSIQGWMVEAGRIAVTLAGKNVAGFDLPFLRSNGPWDSFFKTGHRCFDPGSLYYEMGDSKIPDLATCLRRAGYDGVVGHRAVGDALDVVRLLRYKYIDSGSKE